MGKILTLEDVVKGVRPIVEADPDFIYPQQDGGADGENDCTCVEVDTSDSDMDEDGEYPEEYYLYEECPWHLDDDNTCRYVREDNSPACVVGHYFVKELGFDDLYNFETKAPTFILEATATR